MDPLLREKLSIQTFLSIHCLLCALALLAGCALQRPLQREQIGDIGYFEFREPASEMSGVTVGVPRAGTEPAAEDYGEWISDHTGAGLVVARGFGSKRLAVSQPLVRSVALRSNADSPLDRGSVYREFKKALRRNAEGRVRFYFGVRCAAENSGIAEIEVASSGLTFEQLAILKRSYAKIRDELLPVAGIPHVSLAIEPLDGISWRVSGIKHHGVLMIAERGISIRLPAVLATDGPKEIYQRILARWAADVFEVATDNRLGIHQVVVRLGDLGRIEITPSRRKQHGIVVGAPHGSYDEFTAEAVRRIGYRTGFATVVAKGFTPTEAGGWRINVNRPTEKTFFSTEFELRSDRARSVYEAYRSAVLQASQGPLALYVDIHQYATDRQIQVATVGISKKEAAFIKATFRRLRDSKLKAAPQVEPIELVIEPLDAVEIGAWATKADGILTVARKSLHFEVPGYGLLFEPKPREVYTGILSDLLSLTVPVLAPRGILLRNEVRAAGASPDL